MGEQANVHAEVEAGKLNLSCAEVVAVGTENHPSCEQAVSETYLYHAEGEEASSPQSCGDGGAGVSNSVVVEGVNHQTHHSTNPTKSQSLNPKTMNPRMTIQPQAFASVP